MTSDNPRPAAAALAEIRDGAYWRVRLVPQTVGPRLASQGACFEVVEQSRVSIRGWDYPHTQDREDTRHGLSYPIADGWELWVRFMGHHETWRFMRSGQFAHFFRLWEDTEGAPAAWRIPEGTRFLSLESSIATITEVVEFAGRLARIVDYSPALTTRIELVGMQGRRLLAGPNRWLSGDYISHQGTITAERELPATPSGLQSDEAAVDMAIEVFRIFGFDIARHIVQEIRTNVLERRGSY